MTDLHTAGEIIRDRYTIQTPLGQGAVATTYRAIDNSTGQTVAIKVMSFQQTTDWKVLELFEREAETLATLDHPQIPHYVDYFYLDVAGDRRFYIVQELISGHSLETLIREREWQPSETEIRGIVEQILDILDYLHSRDRPVIHRDIKPQNLILTDAGQIVLVDFGAVQEAFRHTISRGGTFVGTVDYMPPEQFRGQATYASDLYSLGVTLIDLITGSTTIGELPAKRLKFDFQAVAEVSPSFAAWLDRLIEPAVEDRFQSVQDARAALPQDSSLSLPNSFLPSQSQIVIQRSPERLMLYIPPAKWNVLSVLAAASNWTLVGFWGLLSGVAVSILWQDLLSALLANTLWSNFTEFLGGLIVVLLVLAVWGVPWWVWRLLRRFRGDRVELDLRSQSFRLQYFCFPCSRTVVGDSAHLTLQVQGPRQGLKLLHFPRRQPLRHSFWGYRWQSNKRFEYQLGQWLTLTEQAWLAQELSQFVEQAQVASAKPDDWINEGQWNFDLSTTSSDPTTIDNLQALAGSRIRLKQTSDRFELVVPPILQGRSQTGLVVVVVLLSLMTLPVSLIILPMIIGVMGALNGGLPWAIAGRFALRIDRDRFQIRWRYLGWEHTVNGKTEQIQDVSLSNTQITVNGQPLTACALKTHRHNYLFGSWLRPHEKDAVVAQLQGFLTEPSQPDSINLNKDEGGRG